MDSAPVIASISSNITNSGYESNYSYCIRANYGDGSKIPSALFFQTDLTDDLSSTNYNIIIWTPTNVCVDARASSDFLITTVIDGTHLIVNSTVGMLAGDTITQVSSSSSTTITIVTDSTHLIVGNTSGFLVTASSYDTYRCWTNGSLGFVNTTAYGLIGNTTGNTFSDAGQSSDNSLIDNSPFNVTIESITDSTHIVVSSTTNIVANDEIAMDIGGEEPAVTIISVIDSTHLQVSNSATLSAGLAIVGPGVIVGPPLINM